MSDNSLIHYTNSKYSYFNSSLLIQIMMIIIILLMIVLYILLLKIFVIHKLQIMVDTMKCEFQNKLDKLESQE